MLLTRGDASTHTEVGRHTLKKEFPPATERRLGERHRVTSLGRGLACICTSAVALLQRVPPSSLARLPSRSPSFVLEHLRLFRALDGHRRPRIADLSSISDSLLGLGRSVTLIDVL